ncbi:MAG TPA: alpha/beta hydrolase fold domain-containing protein [Nitrospira sp.]|nr:alpha/beta hydrolase fold domain-containing protein [Nitrospira sp.]
MVIHLRAVARAWLFASPLLLAQQPARQATTAAEAPARDTTYIEPDGTARISRVIPVPQDLSPEAQKFISERVPDETPPEPLAARRSRMDEWGVRSRAEWSRLCPNHIEESSIGGVPVRIVTPDDMPSGHRDRVLMNLHGGSFNADSGSFAESIPIAGYTRIKVVAVLYRLAPEHPFPAAIDDAVAVYRELLKTYRSDHIIVYGTSAGAVLTAELAVKLKQLRLPMPAALGIFSALGSFARMGDSWALYTLRGLAGHIEPPDGSVHDPYYVGSTDPRDPVLSPIYADLHGLPPALFISSGRDALLSGTANLERAYLRAGIDARLVVFDALPHAFWYHSELPESIEACHIMSDFFLVHLPRITATALSDAQEGHDGVDLRRINSIAEFGLLVKVVRASSAQVVRLGVGVGRAVRVLVCETLNRRRRLPEAY